MKPNSYVKKQRDHEAAHPLRSLAGAIIHRLENPKLKASQRDAAPKFGRGSNARKKVVRAYAPADSKKSVSFGGHRERPLSETDRAEVLGAVTVALLAAPTDARTLCHALGIAYRAELPGSEPVKLSPGGDLLRHGECLPCRARLGLVALDFPAWKQCFTAARGTLAMKRKTARAEIVDSLEELLAIDFHGDLSLDRGLIAAQKEQRADEEHAAAAARALIDQKTREMIRAVLAARRGDASRRSRANFFTACRYLRRARKAALGEGHAHGLTRTAAYEQDSTFREYLAEGEKQIARDRAAATATWQESETTPSMFAIAD